MPRPSAVAAPTRPFAAVRARIQRFLYERTTIVLLAILVGSTVCAVYPVHRLHRHLGESLALAEARRYADAVEAFRALYTSEVVSRARAAGITVTHDYRERPDAIPLPATLTHLVGERMQHSLRLYSDKPFPWRTQSGGPADAFEREALIALRAAPDRPFFRFEPSPQGGALRYAVADVMGAACVSCHNTHPDSPKTDWRVGDVRGALSFSMPLPSGAAAFKGNVAHLLGGLVGSTGLALAALIVVVSRFRGDADSERRLNTELAAANRRLEESNRELDEFSYVASHDLQEPLRKLVSYSELLAKDVPAELPAEAVEDLDFISDAARRMQRMVQDLLALSRAGRKPLDLALVRLDDCVDEALAALAARIADTGAEIVRVPLPSVVGDRTLLTHLYLNLIGNALKFSRGRPRVELTLEEGPGHPTLGVRDHGIGFDPRYASQVFAPFKRLHGRSEYEGTGIGLSICRRAVERHGGKIWVDSSPGQGSHFRFTLAHAPLEPADWTEGETS